MPIPPPLEIDVAHVDDACVIRTQGDLNFATAPALEDALLHALDSGAASIVLDLGRVSFIDSMGQRVLVWAANQSREDGDRLRIDCGSGPVRRMMELKSLDRRLPPIAGRRRTPLLG